MPTSRQAVAIIYCARQLTKWKFAAVYLLIGEGAADWGRGETVLFTALHGRPADKERDGSLPRGVSFTAFWLIGLVYALVAALIVVFVEPASGGSGIPEVKMILNGVKMPRVTRFKTLVCRVLGNIFSVSSGLPGEAQWWWC